MQFSDATVYETETKILFRKLVDKTSIHKILKVLITTFSNLNRTGF